MLFLSIVLPHPVEESVVLYFICRQKLAKALRDKLSRPIIFTCVSYAEARIIAIGWTSVLLSVRPSVRPSHAGIVSKLLKLSPNSLHGLVAP